MTTIQRTCSTCSSFMADDGGCYRLATLREPKGTTRSPPPDDLCGEHQTPGENDIKNEAIAVFWVRLTLPRSSLYADDALNFGGHSSGGSERGRYQQRSAKSQHFSE